MALKATTKCEACGTPILRYPGNLANPEARWMEETRLEPAPVVPGEITVKPGTVAWGEHTPKVCRAKRGLE